MTKAPHLQRFLYTRDAQDCKEPRPVLAAPRKIKTAPGEVPPGPLPSAYRTSNARRITGSGGPAVVDDPEVVQGAFALAPLIRLQEFGE